MPRVLSAWLLRRLAGFAAAALFAALLAWRLVVIVGAAALAVPRPTPLFEDSRGGFLSDGEAVYGALGYWDLPQPLPERVRRTAIAVEDRRFALHAGVDPIGLGRAVLHTLGGHTEGGSTIAMQAIRLARPRKRSLFAKAEEAASALVATACYGREGVLRRYLEVLPMGGNMYGIAYAARRYFRVPPQDLSWAQSAMLFAVPQNPSGRALFDDKGFVNAKARALAILGQLRAQGVIDPESYESARYELREMPPFFREARPDDSYHFVLRALDEYSKSPNARLDRPIRTSLDPRVQELASELAAAAIPEYRRLGADNLALIVADATDGDVLAYVGSAGYFDDRNKGSIDYCRVPRSSGSTLKPFLYAFGLETGAFGPGSVLADMPLRIKDRGGEYSLTDFDDSYMGPMLYRRALGNSRNVPAIRVLDGIGLEDCYERLGRLGLHDFERRADFYGYGMAVGGIYTSLDKLVSAYGCLASDGHSFPLAWFPGAPRDIGSVLISEASARMISLFLSDTESRLPSFAGTALTNFPFPVAVKTGTSNGFRDAWALGYSRRYVIGLWIGHSDHLRMNHVAGSTVAALLLELFEALQPEAARGVGEEPFPPPRGWTTARICADSGALATEACPHTVLERFAPGAEPRQACRIHARVVVDSSTGEPASPSTPLERRVAGISTDLGPEYAAYSIARGFVRPGISESSLASARLSLSSPIDGTRVVIDPDTPARFQTLALRANVSPPVPEIVWLVDGREFARAAYPYEARWPISPGRHRISARFPRAFVESQVVSVFVSGG
jgi:penicillin-binding protein 1C